MNDDDARRFGAAFSFFAAISGSRAYDRTTGLQPMDGAAGSALVHLCIGQAYAFSVFNLPITKLLANLCVRAVDKRHHTDNESAGTERARAA